MRFTMRLGYQVLQQMKKKTSELSRDCTKTSFQMLCGDNCSVVGHIATDEKKVRQACFFKAILNSNSENNTNPRPGDAVIFIVRNGSLIGKAT